MLWQAFLKTLKWVSICLAGLAAYIGVIVGISSLPPRTAIFVFLGLAIVVIVALFTMINYENAKINEQFGGK